MDNNLSPLSDFRCNECDGKLIYLGQAKAECERCGDIFQLEGMVEIPNVMGTN